MIKRCLACDEKLLNRFPWCSEACTREWHRVYLARRRWGHWVVWRAGRK